MTSKLPVSIAFAFGMAALGAAWAPAASARPLTVTGWGGPSQAAQSKVYYEPFADANHIKVLQELMERGHWDPSHQGRGRPLQLGRGTGRGR